MDRYEQWSISSGVGLTALGAAAGRAIESTRPDRLVHDPYAAAFVSAIPSPLPDVLRWPRDGDVPTAQEAVLLHGSVYMGVRSRFFDDYLAGACTAGVGQVVLLAAGLDTRAFRLDWPPGLALFEIDQPQVLHFKDAVLRGTGARTGCTRHTVGVDLRGGWPDALLEAGFDPRVPTAWLAEGLLPYLPVDAERRLFAYVDGLSAPGSHLSVDRAIDVAGLLDGGGLGSATEGSEVEMARLLHVDARPDAAAWLTGRGWAVVDEPATVVAGRYDRSLADPRLARLSEAGMHMGDYLSFLSARRTE